MKIYIIDTDDTDITHKEVWDKVRLEIGADLMLAAQNAESRGASTKTKQDQNRVEAETLREVANWYLGDDTRIATREQWEAFRDASLH